MKNNFGTNMQKSEESWASIEIFNIRLTTEAFVHLSLYYQYNSGFLHQLDVRRKVRIGVPDMEQFPAKAKILN